MVETHRGGRRGGHRPHRGNRPINTMAQTQGRSMPQQQPLPQTIPRVSTPPLTAPIPENSMRFADLGALNLLHPVLLKTILEDLKFDHMMPVQEATLRDLLEQRIDCLAQAKTGTGKTIAFLLPAIQTLINRNRPKGSGISLLVISPTRELAMQIAKEGSALLQRLPQFKVSFAIGGTNKNTEERAILSPQGCDILIATPGRLYDHLSNPAVVQKFAHLDTLVLDEADRLLDMGFMDALKKIIACLPDKDMSHRQGMLFSATIAPHVQKFAHLALSKNYKFISTIKEGEQQTHERVPQGLIVVPTFSDLAPAMVSAIQDECKLEGSASFKCIIFAPTAAMVNWYADILSRIGGLPKVSIIHSRSTQSARSRTTEGFRQANSSILVATDVIARGMDFPNVSNVFQVGIPMDKESYIHRLGRTGRAGAEGRSTFIVTQVESYFPQKVLREISFDVQPANLSSAATVNNIAKAYSDKGRVYQAWLGYYKTSTKALQWSTEDLVREANTFAKQGLGCSEIPGIEKTVVGKMGLKGVAGLNVIANVPRQGSGRGGGRGGADGAGGREANGASDLKTNMPTNGFGRGAFRGDGGAAGRVGRRGGSGGRF